MKMINLGILPPEFPRIKHFDLIFKELTYQLEFAHTKRIDFTIRLQGQLNQINLYLATLRESNVSTKQTAIDLIV
ncbi:hypothetical protein ISS30_07515 [bacterium]|nr:hypothetical protein [FCB group bacterium]MBL7191529.1 hypothetical protein [bacterium]